MLDQVRHDLQHRLDDLLAEADKLRRALAALATGDGTQPATSDSSPTHRPRRRDTDARTLAPVRGIDELGKACAL